MQSKHNQNVRYLILIAIIALSVVRPVKAAAPIQVTTNVDEFGSGPACSLREAIEAVNLGTSFGGCSNPGVIDIHLPPNTYTLTGAAYDLLNFTGDLNIRHDMTITGDDYINTIINGPSGDRILRIDIAKTVTIDNITFQYGQSPNKGGAIYNNGTLIMNYVSIHNNSAAGSGGGIYNSYEGEPVATLSLAYTKVFSNTATESDGKGGGIANNSGAIDLSSSDIYGNNAYGDGGGVWSSSGYLCEINSSLVHNNISQNGSGGNVYNIGPMNIDKTRIHDGNANLDGGNIYSGYPGGGGAIMNITNSDISFGAASGNGGGIANDGWLTITNVSFYWNLSSTGAALYTSEPVGTTTLEHVTMSGNLTGSSGAYDIYNSVPANPVVVNNSILDAGISTGCVGAVASTSSYNIDSGTSCSLPAGQHNLSSADPLLGVFEFHGGTTMTFPLAFNSPAVDTAKAIGCPVTDQRGVLRPIDANRDGINGCDIGAYELQLKAYVPVIKK